MTHWKRDADALGLFGRAESFTEMPMPSHDAAWRLRFALWLSGHVPQPFKSRLVGYVWERV